MKRSKKIALTLIASVSITACGQDTDYQKTSRELYSSKKECSEDWGGDDKCEDREGGGYYGPHYYYYGGRPFYFPRGSEKPVPVESSAKFANISPGMRSGRSAATVSSTYGIRRGGFGFSSLFHGAHS